MPCPPSLSSSLVYVVDCDITSSTELQVALTKHKITVKVFHNAEEMLSIPINASARCLVVEEVLSGISGIELLEKMNDSGLRIPTIVLTNNNSIGSAVRAMKAKAADYLERPVSTQVIVDKVLNL